MIFSFRDAFTAAFHTHQREIIWIRNPNLKTTAIFCYVVPAIGRYMDFAVLRELPADASFYSMADVPEIKNKQWPEGINPEICLEHENRPENSHVEMQLLARLNSKVSVLITYQVGTVSKQIDWANNQFRRYLLSANRDREFVLVLPGAEGDPSVTPKDGSRHTPQAGWWNFFKWDSDKHEIIRLP